MHQIVCVVSSEHETTPVAKFYETYVAAEDAWLAACDAARHAPTDCMMLWFKSSDTGLELLAMQSF